MSITENSYLMVFFNTTSRNPIGCMSLISSNNDEQNPTYLVFNREHNKWPRVQVTLGLMQIKGSSSGAGQIQFRVVGFILEHNSCKLLLSVQNQPQEC